MWIPPETKDPLLFHHPTRKSMGYFGAVRISDGKFLYQREEDKFNGESFFKFMKLIRQRASRRHRRIIVILDNARYHHANLHKVWRQEHQDHFELLFLPPYCPHLNPIERVWKLTRRQCIHNRYFADLKSVEYAIEPKFNTWGFPNSELKRLCAIQ